MIFHNLISYVLDDKELYRKYKAHKKIMQTYHERYSPWERRDFIPDPKKRSLSFIQMILGISHYRYWNVKQSRYV